MSIILKNGLVYDGAGSAPFSKDVFIQGEKITGIGNFSNDRNSTVIDARGDLIVPGFIDINSTADIHCHIFDSEKSKNILKSGVTTIIGGNNSFSFAPLMGRKSIEKLRKLIDSPFNINSSSVGEFIE